MWSAVRTSVLGGWRGLVVRRRVVVLLRRLLTRGLPRTITLLCILLSLVTPIHTETLRLGIGYHDLDRLQAAVDLTLEIRSEVTRNLQAVFGLSKALVTGGTVSVYQGVNLGCAIGRCSVGIGVGLGIVQDSARDLGSGLLIRLSGEVGYGPVSIGWIHYSNGKAIFGWDIPNPGLDCVTLFYKIAW